MDPLEYLRAIQRRWLIVVAAVAVAVGAGFITHRVAPTVEPPTTYEARTVLIRSSGTTGGLQTIALFAKVGEVPKRVAEKIGYTGDPLDLASRVSININDETGVLNLSATSTDPDEARLLSETWVTELAGFLRDRKAESLARQADSTQQRLDETRAAITDLDSRIGRTSGSDAELLREERDALIRRYGLLQEAYQDIASRTAADDEFQVIQEPTPRPIVAEGFQAPTSRLARLSIAGLVGLLAGLALALVIDRVDTRIRSRQAAEKHYGLPVLAEIPFLKLRKRSQLAVNPPPAKASIDDAFWLLGAAIRRPPAMEDGRVLQGVGGGRATGRVPRTILVTSATAGEGKTTIAAKLATTLGELGNTVAVMSCDFRRPRLHQVFGVPNESGITDFLDSPDGQTPVDLRRWATPIGRVQVVTSGGRTNKRPEMLGSEKMKRFLNEVRRQADIVIIDSAPVLSGDTAHLLPEVDAVLVVSRYGKTRAEAAERTGQVLQWLGAPVVGVALNFVKHGPGRGYYYGYMPKEKPEKDRGNSPLARLAGKR